MGGRVYEEMVRNGVKTDILTYNALILGLCKDGKTKDAGFVRELDKENLIPNTSTYSALITGLRVRNNSERAFLIYRSMVLRYILGRLTSPDLSTLSELCDGLCRCGKNQLALALCSEVDLTKKK